MGLIYEYGGSSRKLRWWDVQDDDVFICKCGWRGTFYEGANQSFAALIDSSCMECDTMLAIRIFATPKETEEAAANGDPRAQKAAEGHREVVDRWKRAKSLELKEDSELPDVDGEDLTFTWDFEQADDEFWTLISVGDVKLWRELAYWEGGDRYHTVRDLLKQRYGSAFGRLVPTQASLLYLLGDVGTSYDKNPAADTHR